MFEKKAVRNKREAELATQNVLFAINKNEREVFEEIRRLIDDTDTMTFLKCKTLEDYYKKYFNSEFKVDSFYNKLNVARMLHKFKSKKVDVPLAVAHRNLRTLQGAFKDASEEKRLELQIKSWKLAVEEKGNKPNVQESDIKQAIAKVEKSIEIIIEDEEDDSDEVIELSPEEKLILLEEQYNKTNENYHKSVDSLPEEIKIYVVANVADKIAKEGYFWNNLTDLRDMLDDELTFDEIVEEIDENASALKKLLKELRPYEDEKKSLKKISKNLFDLGLNRLKKDRQQQEITKLKRKLKK